MPQCIKQSKKKRPFGYAFLPLINSFEFLQILVLLLLLLLGSLWRPKAPKRTRAHRQVQTPQCPLQHPANFSRSRGRDCRFACRTDHYRPQLKHLDADLRVWCTGEVAEQLQAGSCSQPLQGSMLDISIKQGYRVGDQGRQSSVIPPLKKSRLASMLGAAGSSTGYFLRELPFSPISSASLCSLCRIS